MQAEPEGRLEVEAENRVESGGVLKVDSDIHWNILEFISS